MIPDTWVVAELDTDLMHPWIGLDWVGLDWAECWKNLDGLDWIGLRRMTNVILCYRWSKQVRLDY